MKVIRTICVCGAGTMGSGIAQVAAQAGFEVILYDLDESMLKKARSGIERGLGILVSKNKIDATAQKQILGRIKLVTNSADCKAQVCIEAILEDMEVKSKLFHQLILTNDPDTIFATNTSSLSVTAIAEQTTRPEQVIGMHFFNPAPVMKLVEIVNTQYTAPPVSDAAYKLAQALGKTPVACRDSPGFIVNRVARPFYIESLRLVEEGLLQFEQLDAIMESSGFKLGPFRLMDLIGNDVNFAVSRSVYEQMGRPDRLRPSQIQEEKVNRSELGKKSGRGYYDYSGA